MTDVGRLGGAKGVSHSVEQATEPTKGPKTYEDAFASSNVQDLQASCKAYMEKAETKNPLKERIIVPFKESEHPHGGKEIIGPAINIPLNRVGG